MIYAVASRRIFEDLLDSSGEVKSFKLRSLVASSRKTQAMLYGQLEQWRPAMSLLEGSADAFGAALNEMQAAQKTMIMQSQLEVLTSLGLQQNKAFLKDSARDTFMNAMSVARSLQMRFAEDPLMSLTMLERVLNLQVMTAVTYSEYDADERATAIGILQEVANQIQKFRDGGLSQEILGKLEISVRGMLAELREKARSARGEQLNTTN